MEFKNWLIESKKKRDNTRAKVKGREKRVAGRGERGRESENKKGMYSKRRKKYKCTKLYYYKRRLRMVLWY